MKAAFLFPGQGAQFAGMGQDLLRQHPHMKRRLEQAGERMGLDLLRVMAKGPNAILRRTDIAQAAILTLSVVVADWLVERGVAPAAVAGHSLGQFSALVTCGAASFDDALALVIERGRLMHESNQRSDGAMLAVAGLTSDRLTDLVSGIDQAWMANINSPDQAILSGTRTALKQAQDRVVQAGGRAVWLDVAGAYHSPLLQEASDRFSEAVERLPLNDAQVPLIGNSNAQVMQVTSDLRAELHRHMLMPVRWAQTLVRLQSLDIDRWVEVGPGKVLRGLALRSASQVGCMGTDSARELDLVIHALKGEAACASS